MVGVDGSPSSLGALQWATQHSLGFFFSAALVGGRFEPQNERIARWLLRTVWFAVPIVLAACWAFLLLASSTFVPYGTTGDAASIVIATLAALLPWTLAGVVMC